MLGPAELLTERRPTRAFDLYPLETLIPRLGLCQLALKLGNALPGALGFVRATGNSLVGSTGNSMEVSLSGCYGLTSVVD